ncbi:hypothetical protein NBRC110019_20560 [Neptunitalea chrysea]|uniref:Uncharacterized protein n=1 Tax=Neptunitalea chrysea TaxID=1647581 RepID=A0A9W6EVJ9_9FLAO|nr:hypothetical protein NBRC110019_20560 [Neptunitalea chrysea]
MFTVNVWGQNDTLCKHITVTYSDSLAAYTYSSPEIKGLHISEQVVNTGEEPLVKIHLSITKKDLKKEAIGAALILEDHKFIIRGTEEVTYYKTDTNQYTYNATITLTPEDIILLQKKRIITIMISGFTNRISSEENETLKSYLACILNKIE